MKSNPWFWGGMSRWQFEQELQKNAVQLRDKNVKVKVHKHTIEEVRERKNALAAKGVMLVNAVSDSAPRKIK